MARKFIHRCQMIEWPPFHSGERNVMLEIASQILVYLSPEVTMEKRYHVSLVSSNPTLPKTLTTSPLGMGSNYAWHGTIDTRARGGVVICQGEEEGCWHVHSLYMMTTEMATTWGKLEVIFPSTSTVVPSLCSLCSPSLVLSSSFFSPSLWYSSS